MTYMFVFFITDTTCHNCTKFSSLFPSVEEYPMEEVQDEFYEDFSIYHGVANFNRQPDAANDADVVIDADVTSIDADVTSIDADVTSNDADVVIDAEAASTGPDVSNEDQSLETGTSLDVSDSRQEEERQQDESSATDRSPDVENVDSAIADQVPMS
jgi:hypothetical protein